MPSKQASPNAWSSDSSSFTSLRASRSAQRFLRDSYSPLRWQAVTIAARSREHSAEEAGADLHYPDGK